MPRGRPLAHKLALVYIRCIRSHTPSRQNRAPRNLLASPSDYFVLKVSLTERSLIGRNMVDSPPETSDFVYLVFGKR